MSFLGPAISALKSCLRSRTRPGFLNNLQEIYTSVNSSAYKLQNYTKNAFFMSHWGEMSNDFHTGHPPLQICYFFIPFFQGKCIGHHLL